MASGLLGLVGSGEFLPVMEDADRHLLDGRPQHLVHLATAAAPEGDASLGRWTELAAAHAQRLGVTVDSVPVHDRDDAADPALATRMEGAGLIYLSGGNPGYLANTLRDSAVWRAILDAWTGGASVAGCSAGAMAMTTRAPDVRAAGAMRDVAGLALLDGLAVLPHFDRMMARRPNAVSETQAELGPGVTLVGVDEDTAMVGDGSSWTVHGRQDVHVFDGDDTGRFGATDVITLNGTR